jgi:hypothetical protein
MGLAFQPAYNLGVTVTPNVTSASVTLGFTSESVVFTNLGATVVYVRVGNAATGAPATTSGYPVLVGSQVSIGKDQDDDTVSFISPGGAGSLHIIQGIGI